MHETSIMISIRPVWCQWISTRHKSVEVRKTKPRIKPPFRCYIYCTANKNGVYDLLEIHATDGKIRKANSMVIGEFICDKITNASVWKDDDGKCYVDNMHALDGSLLDELDIIGYAGKEGGTVYGWHISNVFIYDHPLSLQEFSVLKSTPEYSVRESLKRPPQSWCYVHLEDSNG